MVEELSLLARDSGEATVAEAGIEEGLPLETKALAPFRWRSPRRVAIVAAMVVLAAVLALVLNGNQGKHAMQVLFPRSGTAQFFQVEVPASCLDCKQRHGVVPIPGNRTMHLPQDGLKLPSKLSEDDGIVVSWFGKEEIMYFPGGQIVDQGKGVVLISDAEKGLNMQDPNGDQVHIPLAGNWMQIDVDLGNPGASCGCNVAFFLVSMPASKTNQWGGYYCDANCIGGNCCAEFDLIEMNTHSLQATSHPCSDYNKPPYASQSWACDHIGSPNAKFGNGAMDFGPGDWYTINSQKKFTFRMDFPTVSGVLKGIIKITQGEKAITRTMNDIENMRAPLTDGMSLCLSSWESTDITWLDGGVCHTPERCNRQSATFSNIVVGKLSDSPEPAPAPSPNDGPTCPGEGHCGCDWARQWGCGGWDDGSECFCRCCCEHRSGQCRWSS